MRSVRSLFSLFLVLVLSTTPALGNGGKAKTTLYEGWVRSEREESITFSAELESIVFRLSSVNNKYKVVRLRIQNMSGHALRLSPKEDRIDLLFETGAAVPGILDFASRDVALWDSLPADLRQVLAYPHTVEAWEEESVFIFVANPNLQNLPKSFRYHIASLPRPVEVKEYTPIRLSSVKNNCRPASASGGERHYGNGKILAHARCS